MTLTRSSLSFDHDLVPLGPAECFESELMLQLFLRRLRGTPPAKQRCRSGPDGPTTVEETDASPARRIETAVAV